jgi:hypothetical protein
MPDTMGGGGGGGAVMDRRPWYVGPSYTACSHYLDESVPDLNIRSQVSAIICLYKVLYSVCFSMVTK